MKDLDNGAYRAESYVAHISELSKIQFLPLLGSSVGQTFLAGTTSFC
jgi:hypothetical protein